MAAVLDYRVSVSDDVKHERKGSEGIQVRFSAIRTEAGKKAEELDMTASNAKSTFMSNYESWTAANAVSSTSNLDNAYFNEIVKMGKDAVPFIYKELQKGPTDLVYALDEIFGHPIKYSGFVPLKQTCETWISILKQTEKV